jgi:hypothetical protein
MDILCGARVSIEVPLTGDGHEQGHESEEAGKEEACEDTPGETCGKEGQERGTTARLS